MRDVITTMIEKRDETAIIHLAGNLTALADETLQQAYQTATASGARIVVLNFRATDYINSGGISILISIVTQARRAGQRIRVTGLSAHFQKVFSMVGLTQFVEVYQTLDDALAPA